MRRHRSWRKWLEASEPAEKKKAKPIRVAGYEFYDDEEEHFREKRAEFILDNRANLEEAARRLRLSSDGFCLEAATLVDAAIEALDDGMQNLCRDKPRKSPTEPDGYGF